MSGDLVNALQELAEVLQRHDTLGAALANIAEAATKSVPKCDTATITLSIEGRPVTAAMTARVALELDLMQYDTQDGPCLTSLRTMSTLRLDVAEAGDAFPHFARAAKDRGVVSVLSVPAMWGDDVVATLNLYSRTGIFDETAESIAAMLGAQVAIAVSRSPEFAAARGVIEQGQRDLEDGAQVQMATRAAHGQRSVHRRAGPGPAPHRRRHRRRRSSRSHNASSASTSDPADT